MPLTIPQIIEVGKISQYLSANKNAKTVVVNYGKLPQNNLPLMIKIVREDVEYMYNNTPTDANLFANANYLYSLCGGYAVEAEYIMGISNDGSPLTHLVSSLSNIQFTIGEGDAPANGSTQYVNAVLALNNTYSIYDSGRAGFLVQGVDFSYNVAGGFTLLGGVTFYSGTVYTIII
jgi:hypothetical protein